MSIAKDLEAKKSKKRKKKLEAIDNEIVIAIYRRVSTQEQAEEGYSLNAQKNRIVNYIGIDQSFENKNYSIRDYADEGVSAKDLKRPALKKLLENVENNEINHIIVLKLDRLSRNINNLLELVLLFEKKGVTLVSLYEKIDTQSAVGRFFIAILGSLAQLEREQVSERVSEVFRQIVFNQPVGGRTPFGYIYIAKTQTTKGYYLPYSKEKCEKFKIPQVKITHSNDIIYPAEIIKMIYSWYNPVYNNFNQIAKRLTDLQIPTPQQIDEKLIAYFKLGPEEKELIKEFEFKEFKKWNHKTVKNILTNYFYIGERVWNRYQNRTKSKRENTEWKFVEKSHNPLISAKEFERVMAMIT